MLDKLQKISVQVNLDRDYQASSSLSTIWEYLSSNRLLEDLTLDDFEYPSGLPLSALLHLRWPVLKKFTLIRFGNGGDVADSDALLEFVRAHPQIHALRIDNWAPKPDSKYKPIPSIALPRLTSLHIHPNLLPVFHPADGITSLAISRAHNFSKANDHDVIFASSRYSHITHFEMITNGCQAGGDGAEHYRSIYKALQQHFPRLEELRIRYHPWRGNSFHLVRLDSTFMWFSRRLPIGF